MGRKQYTEEQIAFVLRQAESGTAVAENIRRRTSVHISMSAYTPRASLSVGGNHGSAAILLTDNAAELCAAFFDRPGYPAARCTFRPAFTKSRQGPWMARRA